MDPVILSREDPMQQTVHQLGILILLWRRQYGFTQLDLAKRTGLMQSYISGLETGSIDPRLSTLFRVLQGFDDMTLYKFLMGPYDEWDIFLPDGDRQINFH